MEDSEDECSDKFRPLEYFHGTSMAMATASWYFDSDGNHRRSETKDDGRSTETAGEWRWDTIPPPPDSGIDRADDWKKAEDRVNEDRQGWDDYKANYKAEGTRLQGTWNDMPRSRLPPEERRIAWDGESYTFSQFLDYYDEEAQEYWNSAFCSSVHGRSVWNFQRYTRHLEAHIEWLDDVIEELSHTEKDLRQSIDDHEDAAKRMEKHVKKQARIIEDLREEVARLSSLSNDASAAVAEKALRIEAMQADVDAADAARDAAERCKYDAEARLLHGSLMWGEFTNEFEFKSNKQLSEYVSEAVQTELRLPQDLFDFEFPKYQ